MTPTRRRGGGSAGAAWAELGLLGVNERRRDPGEVKAERRSGVSSVGSNWSAAPQFGSPQWRLVFDALTGRPHTYESPAWLLFGCASRTT
jgi:hypothetical protein